MKRLLTCTLLVLGSAVIALAQAPSPTNEQTPHATPIDFARTSCAQVTLLDPSHFSQPSFLPDASRPETYTDWSRAATATMAAPEPAPKPKFVFGGRDDFRWQLGIGVAFLRFRSSIFNASAVGINTSLSYFTNNWFAVEGNIGATFAPPINGNNHVKITTYTAGPKIAWRQRKWEPWLHGLVGGIHEQPQTASGSRNAFALQLGGGADYRWLPRLALRLEADYVRTGLFSEHQDNFHLAGGIVFHF